MIPRTAHFVFGLREQRSPFHFLHYVSIESCRRMLEPETIFFHHKNLPFGPWWERIRPYLTLVEVDDVPEVAAADYSAGFVPTRYRYAHHADFLRLDALVEHGGVYADIDTIFLRPFPDELFAAPFVIGREPAVRDEHTGERRPSLCNALLMAEEGAAFARAWRARMAAALNGSWSNHSGFLSAELSEAMPDAVRVEPESTFYAFGSDPTGLERLLVERHRPPDEALSVHLWAHLWWERRRLDFSVAHEGWCTPTVLQRAGTTLSDLTRAYLPQHGTLPAVSPADRWTYIARADERNEGDDASRLVAALGESGLSVTHVFLPNGSVAESGPARVAPSVWTPGQQSGTDVIVTQLPAPDLPDVRDSAPEALLVVRSGIDEEVPTDPWLPCLNQADLVVVPSRIAEEAATASGLTAPVVVIPPIAPLTGLDVGDGGPDLPATRFVFYAIGAWDHKSALSETVEAYLRAFTSTDPVLLIVSTSARDHTTASPPTSGRAAPGTSAWAFARLLARHKDPADVHLLTDALGPEETSGLHRRGDCFVSLSRSATWSREAFTAAAVGNQVVITGLGGHLDYLGDSPYLVAFELSSRRGAGGRASHAPALWAEPDIQHAATQLRAVYADRSRAAALAAATAERLHREYGPAAIAARWRAAIDQCATRELASDSPSLGGRR